jgi:hypothetical protein
MFWILNNNEWCVIGRPGTAYPSGAPEYTPGFSGVRVAQS